MKYTPELNTPAATTHCISLGVYIAIAISAAAAPHILVYLKRTLLRRAFGRV
jgi:hypothetical protein